MMKKEEGESRAYLVVESSPRIPDLRVVCRPQGCAGDRIEQRRGLQRSRGCGRVGIPDWIVSSVRTGIFLGQGEAGEVGLFDLYCLLAKFRILAILARGRVLEKKVVSLCV